MRKLKRKGPWIVLSFSRTEIPEFLVEKEMTQEVDTIASLTAERDRLLGELLEEEDAVEQFMLETGGASDKSDSMQEGVDHLRSELEAVEEKLKSLYEQMEADAFDEEAAYKLGNRYISIQKTKEGYDYSIYDEGYRLLDGGVYDNPDVSIGEVMQEITDELKQPIYDEAKDTFSHSEIQGNIRQSDIPERVDYEDLMEKTGAVGLAEVEKVKSTQEIIEDFRSNTERMFRPERVDGMRPSDIEEAVRDRVQQMIDEYELDAKIEDVIVSGSRSRGLDNENSDLDVVVSFSGTEREDDFFNILHDEKMYFGSVELDINPIGTEQTGTLAEYLPGVEKYLSEKSEAIEQAVIVDFPDSAEAVRQSGELERQPKQQVTFTVAESSEFHSFGELHEGIPTLQDAIKIYEKLCEESKLNAIPALGINLHTVGTQEHEDVQWDFLSGGRIDLEGLMYLPEMSKNAEVMEALHQMAEYYPGAEIIGSFPEERETSGPSVQKPEQETEEKTQLSAIELAAQIDQFAYETDTYEYNDTVEDREANIRGIAESIESRQDGGARAYLNSFVQESDDPETVAQAKALLKKLDEYKPLAKVEEQVEQNYNMIDNMINNLPQDPEEKKEPAPQKVMRIEEHKKVRKRVSMKKKLAEKKAEVTERDGKAPEPQKAVKSPNMGVDD